MSVSVAPQASAAQALGSHQRDHSYGTVDLKGVMVADGGDIAHDQVSPSRPTVLRGCPAGEDSNALPTTSRVDGLALRMRGQYD